MKVNTSYIKKNRGFTLIEIMIVVAITSILAGISVGLYGQYRMKTYNASAASDLRNIMSFETLFHEEYLEYAPVSLADMQPSGIILANVTLKTGSTVPFKISSLNKNMAVIVKTSNTNGNAIGATKHAGGNIILAIDFDALAIKKTAKQGPLSTADVPAPTNANDLAGWSHY